MESGEHNGQGAAPIGAVLEKARRERGLSLHDVEHATKIRTRYLDGLEREDFSVLPDAVYVQGFLKTYANFLGLDGEGMARELKNRRSPRRERQQPSYSDQPRNSEFERPIISPGGLASPNRRRVSAAAVLTVILALVLLAAVIGVLYFIGVQSSGRSAPERPEAPAQGAGEGERQPAQEEEEEPAPQQQGEDDAPGRAEEEREAPAEEPPREEAGAEPFGVTVRVLDSPAGLTISADGEVVADVYAQPGFSQTYEAREVVTVSTANAGAVEVDVDGENLGRLGYYGQPLTRDFAPGQP